MQEEEFVTLVRRLEQKASLDPAGYRSRALLLAVAGNLYLAGVLVLVAVLIAALLAMFASVPALALKLAVVLGGFLWLVLRAIWIRLPPPEGIEVTRQDAPELHAQIDDLRTELGSPHFHHVLVTADFNAAVSQVPRFGVFAGTRNYLLLGLPLLQTLSVEQFRAVLGHEFGHLARGHGRIGNWIYCQRLRWARLAAALEENDSSGRFIFAPLFKRFVPYFTAYSFPLARANEYEADAGAARLTSTRAMAEALTAVNVMGAYLQEKFWPSVHGAADETPAPGFMPFAGLRQRVAVDLEDEADRTRWLDNAMRRKTDFADTHPALSDRLQALGESPRFEPPGAAESADRLLGAALAQITTRLDDEWRVAIQPSWEAWHASAQESRARFAELEQRLESGSDQMSYDDELAHALLLESVAAKPDAALERLRTLVARDPQHHGASFSLGVRLLRRGDDAGIALLERVMANDVASVPQLASILRDYCSQHAREADAQRWHAIAVEAAESAALLGRESSTLRLSDRYERHGLQADALTRLQDDLKSVAGLKRAYLVRKRVEMHGGTRFVYVLGIRARALPGKSLEHSIVEILQRLQGLEHMPEGTVIFSVQGSNYRFGRKFFWMRGAKIY